MRAYAFIGAWKKRDGCCQCCVKMGPGKASRCVQTVQAAEKQSEGYFSAL